MFRIHHHKRDFGDLAHHDSDALAGLRARDGRARKLCLCERKIASHAVFEALCLADIQKPRIFVIVLIDSGLIREV